MLLKKVSFLHSHLAFFPQNLVEFNNGHDEQFHKKLRKLYKKKGIPIMFVDFLLVPSER